MSQIIIRFALMIHLVEIEGTVGLKGKLLLRTKRLKQGGDTV